MRQLRQMRQGARLWGGRRLHCRATAMAVWTWSPVTMAVRMWAACSAKTTSRESGRMGLASRARPTNSRHSSASARSIRIASAGCLHATCTCAQVGGASSSSCAEAALERTAEGAGKTMRMTSKISDVSCPESIASPCCFQSGNVKVLNTPVDHAQNEEQHLHAGLELNAAGAVAKACYSSHLRKCS